MRDARAQSRQERGARRDRELAGRTGPPALIELFARIAAAIVLDLGGFVVWMLASRGPARLLVDVRDALRRPPALLHGLVSFTAGLALLVVGATLLVPVAPTSRTFLLLETWTVLTALLADQLVGLDAQRLLRRR